MNTIKFEFTEEDIMLLIEGMERASFLARERGGQDKEFDRLRDVFATALKE